MEEFLLITLSYTSNFISLGGKFLQSLPLGKESGTGPRDSPV